MLCNAPSPVISDVAAALTADNDSTISLFACVACFDLAGKMARGANH